MNTGIYKRLFLLFVGFIVLQSCDTGTSIVSPKVQNPISYSFEREGQSTVSFSGQTTRIKMATEIGNAMKDRSIASKRLLIEMFRNQSLEGGDVNPFMDTELNSAAKSVKGKVAASYDLYYMNTVQGMAIREQFESWMVNQVDEVFANENTLAAPGLAGQISDGTSVRYISAQGLEYDQMVNKGLIGALMIDQILNNYLSPGVLDAGENKSQNDREALAEGKNYSHMEHKWDEAYGYLFGLSQNFQNPVLTLGEDDFLNKYLGRVDSDSDFNGIAQEIYDAFKLGRAAIVAKNYEIRDEQAAIIKENLSKVIAIRAVHYLQNGKNALPAASQSRSGKGGAFHELSEGLGFVYSLQFTGKPNDSVAYFSSAEIDEYLTEILDGNGFWDVSHSTLDRISNDIADRFDFTVGQTID